MSSIDVILTNRPKCFQKSRAVSVGLSDYHKLIVASMKSQSPHKEMKTIKYRSFRKFDTETYVSDIANINDQNTNVNANDFYENLTEAITTVANKHAP